MDWENEITIQILMIAKNKNRKSIQRVDDVFVPGFETAEKTLSESI